MRMIGKTAFENLKNLFKKVETELNKNLRINQTEKYWNQYYDVTDISITPWNDKLVTCNACCGGMISGKHPDIVLKELLALYGINKKFQWEEHLLKYLKSSEFKCKKITFPVAWPVARKIFDRELKKMRDEIDKGNIIFYHKKGHYQIMVGYQDDNFIFNDPAGDRKISKKLRERKSGKNVVYPYSMVKSEKIYGRCWSIEI